MIWVGSNYNIIREITTTMIWVGRTTNQREHYNNDLGRKNN